MARKHARIGGFRRWGGGLADGFAGGGGDGDGSVGLAGDGVAAFFEAVVGSTPLLRKLHKRCLS